MGIFSDRCEALIDPQTKKALSGEELIKARQDPNWLRCGNQVSKIARGCSACGAAMPGAWAKCPACGKWIGVESQFCWHCNMALHPEDRPAMKGGYWQKPVGVLAKRLEIGDIKQFLHGGKIIIGEGTGAILLQNGQFNDVLRPGEHTLVSLTERIKHWGDQMTSVVVLVDTGDITLPIRVDNIRTAEEIPMSLYTEIVIRAIPDDSAANAFMTNVMKDARELSYGDFANRFNPEIHSAIQHLCNQSTVKDLFKDPELRLHVEDAIQHEISKSEARFGFKLLRISAAEVVSSKYEELRATQGEIEVKRRQVEFDQRLRELLASDKMHLFKSEHDLDEYVKQLAQERGISDEHRNQEINLLRLVNRQEIQAKEAAFRLEQEIQQMAHDIGVKIKWDDYNFDTMVKESQAKTKARDVAFKQEQKETDWALDMRDKKNRLERENLAETAKIHKTLSMQALLAMTDDPAKRADLIKLSQQLHAQGKSADVILAMQAANNPELAKAIAEIQQSKREDRDKDLAERKKLLEESAERLERILKSALETTAEAAKRPATITRIIKR